MRPEREILKNGKIQKFAKYENNELKYSQPELPKTPSNVEKTKESQEKNTNKIENKTTGTKALQELAKRHVGACPFRKWEWKK